MGWMRQKCTCPTCNADITYLEGQDPRFRCENELARSHTYSHGGTGVGIDESAIEGNPDQALHAEDQAMLAAMPLRIQNLAPPIQERVQQERVLTLSPLQMQEVMRRLNDHWNDPNMQGWFNQALIDHIERRLRAFTSTSGIMRPLFNRAQRYYTDELDEPLIGIRQDLDLVIAHTLDTLFDRIGALDNVTTERAMRILDAALLVRYHTEFAITQLLSLGDFELADELSVLSDVNPNADSLLGRLRQGDLQMVRDLARQRFQEGGEYELWNERERAILIPYRYTYPRRT